MVTALTIAISVKVGALALTAAAEITAAAVHAFHEGVAAARKED